MPACIALLSQFTDSLWFTHTCVDKTRFMFSESFCRPLGAPIGGALQPAAVEQDGGHFALRGHELDFMAACFKDGHGVRGKSWLHTQLVRHPLMMEPRPVHGLLDVHLEVEYVDDCLQNRGLAAVP